MNIQFQMSSPKYIEPRESVLGGYDLFVNFVREEVIELAKFPQEVVNYANRKIIGTSITIDTGAIITIPKSYEALIIPYHDLDERKLRMVSNVFVPKDSNRTLSIKYETPLSPVAWKESKMEYEKGTAFARLILVKNMMYL